MTTSSNAFAMLLPPVSTRSSTCTGLSTLELAVALGVDPGRIETIISFERAGQIGAKTAGSVDGTTTEVLAELAKLIAEGDLEIPIAATYPLDQVKDAFAELEDRHTRGKIVLIP